MQVDVAVDEVGGAATLQVLAQFLLPGLPWLVSSIEAIRRPTRQMLTLACQAGTLKLLVPRRVSLLREGLSEFSS